MSTIVLKDVLISAGKLEDYFDGKVPINLWRAFNKRQGKANRAGNEHIFGFVEEPIMLSNGLPRRADITIEMRNGVRWVSVASRPRGVSTFDKSGLPRGKDWEYFLIPQGTALPLGLAIVRDTYNSSFDATHYTIAPAYDMPLDHFKMLLSELAMHVIKEAA